MRGLPLCGISTVGWLVTAMWGAFSPAHYNWQEFGPSPGAWPLLGLSANGVGVVVVQMHPLDLPRPARGSLRGRAWGRHKGAPRLRARHKDRAVMTGNFHSLEEV